MQKITPIRNNILIEVLAEKAKKSVIFIPDSAKKEKDIRKGVVREIGDMVENISVGDVVFYDSYGPQEIVLDEKKFVIAKEEDILCLEEQ